MSHLTQDTEFKIVFTYSKLDIEKKVNKVLRGGGWRVISYQRNPGTHFVSLARSGEVVIGGPRQSDTSCVKTY